MITLVPFNRAHADLLADPEMEPGMLDILGKNPAYWEAIESGGKAFSAFCDGKFLGSGGFALSIWGGSADVWLWALPEARKYPIAVHKLILRILKIIETDYEVFRISCSVKDGNDPAVKWMNLLGFEHEAKMPKFGPGKSLFHLYARVRD